MTSIDRPRILIFGAGSIGRSFIAPVFTNGGYEAVFADVNPVILEALSDRDSYMLVEKNDSGEKVRYIRPVRGVDAQDSDAVRKELEGADICATCVGAAALPTVLKTIARVVINRKRPLDIILAENLKEAGKMARTAFKDAGIRPAEREERLGIVETSIGKMVPIMPAEIAEIDPLLCWAEPFNTLIVDRDGFRGDVPKSPDLTAVNPIEPWVARKLFIHNFGHAAAAYLGYRAHPNADYIWEVLEDADVTDTVRSAMINSGEALRRKYPEVFTAEDIRNHVNDLISRFRNRALGDTVYRVGRDLARKLYRRDRVVGALELIRSEGLDTNAALEVFKAALVFRAAGPSGDPDEKDARVASAVSDPTAFLKDIVGLDGKSEPELAGLLMGAMAETGPPGN